MPSAPLALGREYGYSFRTSVAEFPRYAAFAQKDATNANEITVQSQFLAPVRGGVSMADINPRQYQAWVLATAIDSAESDSASHSQGELGINHGTDSEMDLDITDNCVLASGNSTDSDTCSLTDLLDSDDEEEGTITTGFSTAATLQAKAAACTGSSYRRRLVDFRCMDHRTYLESLASSSSTTPSSLTPSDDSSLSEFDSDAEAEFLPQTASSCRSSSAASKVDHDLQLVTSALAASSSKPKVGHGLLPVAQTQRSNKSDIRQAPSRKAVGVRHVRFALGPETEEQEVDDFDYATDDEDDEGDSESAFELDEDSDDESDVEMRDVKWTEASRLWN